MSDGHSHNYYGGQGGDANIYDRTGLLLAIIAFGISLLFAGVAVMGYVANRDENHRLQVEIIDLETQIKDLQIQLDEFKKR